MKRFSKKIKKEAARDYHFSGMTGKEMAEKYGCGENSPSQWAGLYPREHFLSETDDEQCVIVVKKKDYELALLALEQENVPYEKPNNIIIEQQYESKLNRGQKEKVKD